MLSLTFFLRDDDTHHRCIYLANSMSPASPARTPILPRRTHKHTHNHSHRYLPCALVVNALSPALIAAKRRCVCRALVVCPSQQQQQPQQRPHSVRALGTYFWKLCMMMMMVYTHLHTKVRGRAKSSFSIRPRAVFHRGGGLYASQCECLFVSCVDCTFFVVAVTVTATGLPVLSMCFAFARLDPALLLTAFL